MSRGKKRARPKSTDSSSDENDVSRRSIHSLPRRNRIQQPEQQQPSPSTANDVSDRQTMLNEMNSRHARSNSSSSASSTGTITNDTTTTATTTLTLRTNEPTDEPMLGPSYSTYRDGIEDADSTSNDDCGLSSTQESGFTSSYTTAPSDDSVDELSDCIPSRNDKRRGSESQDEMDVDETLSDSEKRSKKRFKFGQDEKVHDHFKYVSANREKRAAMMIKTPYTQSASAKPPHTSKRSRRSRRHPPRHSRSHATGIRGGIKRPASPVVTDIEVYIVRQQMSELTTNTVDPLNSLSAFFRSLNERERQKRENGPDRRPVKRQHVSQPEHECQPPVQAQHVINQLNQLQRTENQARLNLLRQGQSSASEAMRDRPSFNLADWQQRNGPILQSYRLASIRVVPVMPDMPVIPVQPVESSGPFPDEFESSVQFSAPFLPEVQDQPSYIETHETNKRSVSPPPDHQPEIISSQRDARRYSLRQEEIVQSLTTMVQAQTISPRPASINPVREAVAAAAERRLAQQAQYEAIDHEGEVDDIVQGVQSPTSLPGSQSPHSDAQDQLIQDNLAQAEDLLIDHSADAVTQQQSNVSHPQPTVVNENPSRHSNTNRAHQSSIRPVSEAASRRNQASRRQQEHENQIRDRLEARHRADVSGRDRIDREARANEIQRQREVVLAVEREQTPIRPYSPPRDGSQFEPIRTPTPAPLVRTPSPPPVITSPIFVPDPFYPWHTSRPPGYTDDYTDGTQSRSPPPPPPFNTQADFMMINAKEEDLLAVQPMTLESRIDFLGHAGEGFSVDWVPPGQRERQPRVSLIEHRVNGAFPGTDIHYREVNISRNSDRSATRSEAVRPPLRANPSRANPSRSNASTRRVSDNNRDNRQPTRAHIPIVYDIAPAPIVNPIIHAPIPVRHSSLQAYHPFTNGPELEEGMGEEDAIEEAMFSDGEEVDRPQEATGRPGGFFRAVAGFFTGWL